MPLRQVAVEGLGFYYLVLTHQFEPHEFETLFVRYTEIWTLDLEEIVVVQLLGYEDGKRNDALPPISTDSCRNGTRPD